MSQILRAWLAFAAMGAGILHLALVISSPLPIAVVLVVLGASEFAWGALSLSRDRFPVAAIARAVALAPVLLWGALLLISGLVGAPELASSLTFIPMAVATLFNVVIAISLSVLLRRGTERMPDSGEPGAWRYLGGLFAGGLAVSLLMTPALALTEAGLKNPHVAHSTPESEPAFTVPEHSGH